MDHIELKMKLFVFYNLKCTNIIFKGPVFSLISEGKLHFKTHMFLSDVCWRPDWSLLLCHSVVRYNLRPESFNVKRWLRFCSQTIHKTDTTLKDIKKRHISTFLFSSFLSHLFSRRRKCGKKWHIYRDNDEEKN